MKKPVILMTSREVVLPAYDMNMLSNTDEYSLFIKKAGGIPLTYTAFDEKDAEEAAEIADGLLITGGADIDPSLYNEENNGSFPGSPDTDRSDLLLYHAFVKAHKPVLGICRGIQLIAAAEGAALIQDIESEGKYCSHNQRTMDPKPGKHDFAHDCIFEEGTRLFQIFGRQYPVNTYHHQALKTVPDRFKEAARSTDGIIEAIECGNIVAVQWHPERLAHDEKHLAIAKLFIEDAQRTRPERSSTI